LIAVASLLIVGFGLTGALLVSRAGDTTSVLVAARPVPAGQPISGADLSVARVSGSVRAIAAAQANTVVGRIAAVGMVAGQVLNRDMLTATTVPGQGQVMVGLALAPGQLPGDGLQIGDRVLAVAVPAATDSAGALPAARALAAGQVYGLRPDTGSDASTLVTLLLPIDAAGQVMAEAAGGHIDLVKVAAS
jgi:Flp pilus assembly protein CpaB